LHFYNYLILLKIHSVDQYQLGLIRRKTMNLG